MNVHVYQHAASRTLRDNQEVHEKFLNNKSYRQAHQLVLLNYAIGLAGETGEILEPIKKHIFHGKDLDTESLAKELGDALWYITAIATTLNLSLEEIMEKNIAKLKDRYPDGFQIS